ncbi:NAD(P)-dependent oxidoreductase [Labrys sp. (in: a-proteobacteria)]|uniref:NAD(P)-dependent oxidoreductase n=1 Tax=Labrys sp. (in: a-proteobacteria) TaxID=1917972 RepID=UPI0039E50B4E
MKLAIAVLGTGRMGSALARALLGAGHEVTVWNRTPAKTGPLAALGAVVAPSVAEAVAAGAVVIVNVSDYDATAALLREASVARALDGKLVVELTSGTPQGAREAGGWAAAQGAAYLDGAIMATPDFIGTEAGTILFAGSGQAFEANKPVFLALGGNVQHVGEDAGLANALDSALLGLMWGALFGTLNAIAVCQAEGVALGMLGRLWQTLVPVIDGQVADLIKRNETGRLASDEQSFASIATHHHAFEHLLVVMQARKIDLGVVLGQDSLFRRALAAGRGEDDFAALSRFMIGEA